MAATFFSLKRLFDYDLAPFLSVNKNNHSMVFQEMYFEEIARGDSNCFQYSGIAKATICLEIKLTSRVAYRLKQTQTRKEVTNKTLTYICCLDTAEVQQIFYFFRFSFLFSFVFIRFSFVGFFHFNDSDMPLLCQCTVISVGYSLHELINCCKVKEANQSLNHSNFCSTNIRSVASRSFLDGATDKLGFSIKDLL